MTAPCSDSCGLIFEQLPWDSVEPTLDALTVPWAWSLA